MDSPTGNNSSGESSIVQRSMTSIGSINDAAGKEIDAAARLEDCLPPDNDMRKLGNQLDKIMRNIMTSEDPDFVEMRSLFEITSPNKEPETRRPRAFGVSACCLLSAMRAYDMAVFNDGVDANRFDVVKHPKAHLTKDKGLTTHWSKLDDWIKLLRSAKSCIEAVNNVPERYEDSDKGDTVSKLLSFMASTTKASKGLQIAVNFAHAGLILNMLMNDDRDKALLDIPDELNKALEKARELPANDGMEIDAVTEDSSSRRSPRNVFFLTTMVSPLHLLTPAILASSTFGKSNAIMFAKTLGNDMTPGLTNIVSSIWRAVFSISVGKATPYGAAKHFLQSVDWNALQGLEEEKDWYHTGFGSRSLRYYADVVNGSKPSIDSGTTSTQDVEQTGRCNEDDGHISDDPMEPKEGDGGTPGNADFRVIKDKKEDKMDVDGEEPSDGERVPTPTPDPAPRNSSRLAESSKDKVNLAALMTGSSSKRKRGKASKGKANAPRMFHDVRGARRLQRTSQDITVLIKHIEIDDIEVDRMVGEIDCDHVFQPVKNSDEGQKLFVFTPRGQSINVIPSTCGEDLNRILTAQIAQVVDAYVDEKAIFLLDDPKSNIRIVSNDKLEAAPALEKVAFYIKTPVLVVTGDVLAKARFDEAGLEEIQDLDAICTVQDQTCFPFEEEKMMEAFTSNYFAVRDDESKEDHFYVKGSLRQILTCATKSRGKILNAVDVPYLMDTRKIHFATDVAAWKGASGLGYCHEVEASMQDLRWGHVATKNAFTCWHIASCGLSTFFTCNAGRLTVVVHCDTQSDVTRPHRDSSISRYISNTNPKKGTVEAICLEPGDTIYLQPNTSYFTLALADSVCLGGHFYHHSTMVASLVGMIHMTIAGKAAADHKAEQSWDILHRMLLFYHKVFLLGKEPSENTRQMHVPVMDSLESIVNMFALCALVMWTNALSPDTYRRAFDVPADIARTYGITLMTAYRRQKCSFMKRVAKTMLQWVLNDFEIKREKGEPERKIFSNVFVPFIGNLIVQSVLYLEEAEEDSLVSVIRDADSKRFKQQLLDPFHEYEEIADYVERNSDPKPGSLLVDFGKPISITKRRTTVKIKPYQCKTPTPLDKVYLDGLHSDWTGIPDVKAKSKIKSRQWIDTDEDEEDEGGEEEPVSDDSPTDGEKGEGSGHGSMDVDDDESENGNTAD